MKKHSFKNRLLQLLYRPYKSRLNIGEVVKELDEIEKELEKFKSNS